MVCAGGGGDRGELDGGQPIRGSELVPARAAVAGVVVTAVASAPRLGAIYREREIFHDVEQIGRVVPPGTMLFVEPRMRREWLAEAYLYRRHFISLQTWRGEPAPQYRLDVAEDSSLLPADWTPAGSAGALSAVEASDGGGDADAGIYAR